MRRARRTNCFPALLLTVLVGCCGCAGGGPSCPPPPPSGLPPGQLLAWDVSQGLWGSASLVLSANGAVSYHFQSVKPQEPPEAGEARVDAAEIQRVVDTMTRSAVCGICRQRNGIPDEAAPILRVRAGGLDCRVDAWDGEWRDRAPEVEKLMNYLTTRARPAPTAE